MQAVSNCTKPLLDVQTISRRQFSLGALAVLSALAVKPDVAILPTSPSPTPTPENHRLTTMLEQLLEAETALTNLRQYIMSAVASGVHADGYELVELEQAVIQVIERLHIATHSGDWGEALAAVAGRDSYGIYLEYDIRAGGVLDRAELQREIDAIAETRPTEAGRLRLVLAKVRQVADSHR